LLDSKRPARNHGYASGYHLRGFPGIYSSLRGSTQRATQLSVLYSRPQHIYGAIGSRITFCFAWRFVPIEIYCQIYVRV
jgi:hypothetical protein